MEVGIQGERFWFERILKDDFFSINVLYANQEGQRYVLKLSDFRFMFGWLFRPFAGWISRREYRIYQTVEDIPGIPELGPRYGDKGYFHRYVEGDTLHEIERRICEQFHAIPGHPIFAKHAAQLPPDFFDRLSGIVRKIHERRIFYADLNKRGNIICSHDGNPYLIDFQLCLSFPRRIGWRGALAERIFLRLVQEDLYHVYKHKYTFQPHLMTEEEKIRARRSKLGGRYQRYCWKPYIILKRLIYPHGSNETIWYKWKKQKDQTPRMP